MKMRIALLLLSLTLVCAATAFAHGGKAHVMGTVSSLDAEHVVVKDREGKTVSIRLTKDTMYQKGDVLAPASDLKVGGRVVIDVIGTKDSLAATEIRLSTVPQAGQEGVHHKDHP